MLRALLQKPPYVVAVVEFCVYLIHLSLWYCKLRQRSFVRFLVLCFRWSQKDALCFIVGPIVVLAVRWHCGGCPNCELWPPWPVEWVNSLQSLCWEIGDKSRSWNKFYFSYRSRWIKLIICMYKAVVAMTSGGLTTQLLFYSSDLITGSYQVQNGMWLMYREIDLELSLS